MSTIVLTTGDPAGIGPDISLMLTQDHAPMPVTLLGDRDLLKQRAQQLNIPYTLPDNGQPSDRGWSLHHIPLSHTVRAGEPDVAYVPYVLACLNEAVRGCLQNEYSALVTAPIAKYIMAEHIPGFRGHTEFLAEATQSDDPVMLFVNSKTKTAILTRHIPLKDVPQHITADALHHAIDLLLSFAHQALHIASPQIVVCGLNPHAGDGGLLGTEEKDIIAPVIAHWQNKGAPVTGPISPDTAWLPQMQTPNNIILSLYHDQGLPVVKALDFSHTTQISVGLPFMRTSVDHGTAFHLAGTGAADPSSLKSALAWAHLLHDAHPQAALV